MSVPQNTLLAAATSFALALLGCASGQLSDQLVPAGAVGEVPEPRQIESGQLPDPLAAGWQDQKVCERLHEDKNQRVLRCTFPPGVGHERHFHAPHFGYVVTGSVMQITDDSGTREVEIATGSSWASDGTPWHEVVNVGEATSIYLIVEPK